MTGIVKWYSLEKKFGFIKAEGRDYFFHFSEIQKDGFKSLKAEDTVSFEPGLDKKSRWRATKVFFIAGK